jgi:hypothetical protein
LTRAFSALILFSIAFLELKKGKVDFCLRGFYGRFLSAKKSTAKPMIITTIMAMTAGTKYVLTTDAGAGVGVAVAAGACITVKAFCADDGQ